MLSVCWGLFRASKFYSLAEVVGESEKGEKMEQKQQG